MHIQYIIANTEEAEPQKGRQCNKNQFYFVPSSFRCVFFGLLGYLNPSYKVKINRLKANRIGGKLNETLFELFSFFMHLIKKGECLNSSLLWKWSDEAKHPGQNIKRAHHIEETRWFISSKGPLISHKDHQSFIISNSAEYIKDQ